MTNTNQKSFIKSVMGYLSRGTQPTVLTAQNSHNRQFEGYLDRKAQLGIAQAKIQEYTRELGKATAVGDQQFLNTKIEQLKQSIENAQDQEMNMRELYGSGVKVVDRITNQLVVVNVAEGAHKTVFINAPFTTDDASLRAHYTLSVDESPTKVRALLALLGGEEITLALAQSPGRKAFGIEVKLLDLLTQKITAQWGVYDIPLVADLELVEDADGNQLIRLPNEYLMPFVFEVEQTQVT